jgi:hypothetical protein
MSIDQTRTIDRATIITASGDLWLTISDHLPWEENEGALIYFCFKKNSTHTCRSLKAASY